MIIKYCCNCRADVPHKIVMAGNTQLDSCLNCGFTSSFDYDKFRALVREIENRLEITAEMKNPNDMPRQLAGVKSRFTGNNRIDGAV